MMKALYLSIIIICFLNSSEAIAINSVSKTSTIQVPKTEINLQSKKKLNRWQRFKSKFSKRISSAKKWLKKIALDKELISLALIFGVSMFGSALIFVGSAFVFSAIITSTYTAAFLAGGVAAIGGYILSDYLYRVSLKEKSPLWYKLVSGFCVLVPFFVILAYYTSE